MKYYRIIEMFAIVTFFSSCKKEIYGCTDSEAANYSTLANQNDGSCYYAESATKSTQVTISNWTSTIDSWVTTIPYGEITADVIDHGAVITYLKSGVNTWKTLPLTIYESSSYSITIEVEITVGQIIIGYKNSDGTLPANPGEQIFKISAIY